MLYLAIDQHRKQLTVNLRDEAGDVLLRKQVSTEWEKVKTFFDELQKRAEPQGGYIAIVEVCGFNSWLLKLLAEQGCRETILVQPEDRSKQKTDERDAAKLGELLWVNRQRFQEGKPVQGIRRVHLPSATDQAARQLTCLWERLTSHRTRTLNRIRHILNKHNLHHDMPTKGLQTKACLKWLRKLPLCTMDRLEMDALLALWLSIDDQLAKLKVQLTQEAERHPIATLFRSISGMGTFNSLALACRISDGIERFRRGDSLANYWGVAPGCRNSGETKQRLGGITKVGSRLARLVLGQLVVHVLRKDAWMRDWYKKVKHRRGGKIAFVAVMRKLAVILWKMAETGMPYTPGGPVVVQHRQEMYRENQKRREAFAAAKASEPTSTT